MTFETSRTEDSALLSANVTAIGTSKRQSYEIAAEHQHHADAILAIDPLEVPSPHKFPEGWGHGLILKASALADASDRAAIAAKLASLGPLSSEDARAKEAELTAEVLQRQRPRHIVLGGVGSDATSYHRELAAIACEVNDLQRESNNLQAELERVLRYDTEADPETGELKPVPVYAVTGPRAKAYVERQHDIARQIRLLVGDGTAHGLEGGKRVQRALFESVEARVELQRQVQEEAEAKRRAEQINTERRINARAEALAALQRNGG